MPSAPWPVAASRVPGTPDRYVCRLADIFSAMDRAHVPVSKAYDIATGRSYELTLQP